MKSYFSFLIPLYLMLAFRLWSPTVEPGTTMEGSSQALTSYAALADSVFTATIGSNSPVCAGSALSLIATPSCGIPPYTFAWSGPSGPISAGQILSIVQATTGASGTYSVTVTGSNSATVTASTTVQVYPNALVNAGPDQVLCRNVNAQLAGSVGGGASSAVWTSSVGGTFLPNNTVPTAVFDPPANYTGEVTLTLTSNDPTGPCPSASDVMKITYGNGVAMVAHDEVSVALDETCSKTINASMLLEACGPIELYEVAIFTTQGINIGNTVTGQHVGVPLTARTRDICSGNIAFTKLVVQDNLPPVITCENVFMPCAVTNYDPNYLFGTLNIAHALPTIVENCSNVTLTKFDTWVDVGCTETFNGISGLSGYLKRVWTVKDASNNAASCTQYLYLQRIPLSAIQLPTDITVNCNAPSTEPIATGAPLVQAFGQQFRLFPGSASCEVSVTKTDQVVSVCAGEKSIIRTWTILDLCNGYSATPPNINPINYVQIIRVEDNFGPAFTCPDTLVVSTDPTTCCATVDLPDVIMEDACSYVRDASAIIVTTHQYTGDTLQVRSVNGIPTSFPGNNLNDPDTLVIYPLSPCLDLGTHSVTYYAEDGCGAVSSCNFKIVVQDDTPPLAACDEFTQVALGINGSAIIYANTLDNGSYDNCSDVYFKVRRADENTCQSNEFFYDAVNFCCDDVGQTIDVILRVYDRVPVPGAVALSYEEQHSNDCTIKVLVEDRLKPVCVPPANVTVSCESFDPTFEAHGQASGVDNCCLAEVTTNVNYTNFDSVCNRGTIVRTFRAYDCSGNSNSCTQRITVGYNQDFYVRFPNDVLVTSCNGTAQYGEPVVYGGQDCELMAISYTDEIYTLVPDACMKIERVWMVVNYCTYNPNAGMINVPNPNPNTTVNHPTNMPGPVVSASNAPMPWAPSVVRVNPNDPAPTNYSMYYNPNVNAYRYKQIIRIMDSEKPNVESPLYPVEVADFTENDPVYWNDPIFSDVNGADLPEANSEIRITATDACSGANLTFRYQLFLDLNADGIAETVVSSQTPPTPGTVNYNNVGNPAYSGGTPATFDDRTVPANRKYNWSLQTSTIGNFATATMKWNTQVTPDVYVTPQLPYGKHFVKWFVKDGCGNESYAEYQIGVEDIKAPVVTCLNGLSINIMQTGMSTIFASQLIQEIQDNRSPDNKLEIGIRKSGTGVGFPTDNSGNPQTEVNFDCTELGTQLLEVWAIDQSGNADFCETYVIIQDNLGSCGQSLSVAGAINTENGHGVEQANVGLSSTQSNGLPSLNVFNLSNSNGVFEFNNVLPVAADCQLVPTKDNDPLNGVNTYDLVLISRHILGLEPMNSPYKMIAADANKSGTVTTFDIVELRKLIMGTYNTLPNNSSWRFVDANYMFPNIDNPFQETFPETKSYQQAMDDMMEEDFVAVKVGDIDNTNVPNNLMSSDDRSDKTVFFEVEDREVKPGEIVTATFACTEDILGYQLTVQLNEADLLMVYPGELQSDEHFAMFPDRKAVTSSWDGNGKPEFKIQFRSNISGKLSDLLSVSSAITRAEAYNLQEEKTDVALRFTGVNGSETVSNVGFELYQNQPNPFLDKTVIGFHLPEAADVKLTIFEENGRTLFTETGFYPRGYNRILFDANKVGVSSAMLYYRIETPQYNATKKMLRTR